MDLNHGRRRDQQQEDSPIESVTVEANVLSPEEERAAFNELSSSSSNTNTAMVSGKKERRFGTCLFFLFFSVFPEIQRHLALPGRHSQPESFRLRQHQQ